MFGFVQSALSTVEKPFAAVGSWTAAHGATIATIAVSTVVFVGVTALTGGLGAPAMVALAAGGFASGAAGYATGNLLNHQPVTIGGALMAGAVSTVVTVATAGVLRLATPALTSLAEPLEAAIPTVVRDAVPAVVARTALNASVGSALGAATKTIENAVTGKPLGQDVGEAAIEGGINGALMEPAQRLIGNPITRGLGGLADDAPPSTPEDRARTVAKLLQGSDADRQTALDTLASASDLDRLQTLRALDQSNDTTVRHVYDALDDAGKARLIDLAQAAGKAGTAAGVHQIGVISDCDDTAFPTQYTPDGPYTFKGSGDFYNLVSTGTDGTGDTGNLHFVTARLPQLIPDTLARLQAADMPTTGTFDGDASVSRFAFGGLDGIQQSKIENIDLWLQLHPDQRFVFLGDSLQRDPEVYQWAIQNHPDQVEAVLIHKAGGPVRNPADYAGEIFFDDYAQAKQIVQNLGIPQPGARLQPTPVDIAKLPLPDTDVSAITAKEASESFLAKAKDQIVENVGGLIKDALHPAPSAPANTKGISGALGGLGN